jgi:very-short-patch-repair endonuclease
MPELPDECFSLLKRQRGIIASWQAESAGLSAGRIAVLVRASRWQRVGYGVYAAFTGVLPRNAVLWAAVLRAGPQAALSHQTAGELHGILDDTSRKIHVTVPHEQRTRPVGGLVIHRSRRFWQIVDPDFLPPRTHIEETVLDLTADATSFDDVVALLARTCQRGATTPFRLVTALERRPRMRWRTEISLALQDVADGAHSVLEFRYRRDVERAHGLPASDRQARGKVDRHQVFRDVCYSRYRVLVELDGKASHPDEQRWKDKHRDNAAAADGWVSLRYGWVDVHERACQTSLQVSTVLARQGWAGTIRRCGPTCGLPFPGDPGARRQTLLSRDWGPRPVG